MGWALANVWYDKYEGPPATNSPLESLFMLVSIRRMEAELLSTRALVHASMMTPDSKPDPTIKAFQDYADKILPFLAASQDLERQKERETLLAFTKLRARIDKKEIYKQQAAQLNKHQRSPARHKIRPRMPGL